MAKKVIRNDEGKVVPEHCSCGGKIGVFIESEPIYKCTACGKYYGTMPFPKKSLNESLNRENKNMKKNAIKINESQLREMIAESVKNVLKEELGVAPKMNFGQAASIKAKNLLYDYKELLDIVQGMAETSPNYEDALGKLEAGYDGLYSLAKVLNENENIASGFDTSSWKDSNDAQYQEAVNILSRNALDYLDPEDMIANPDIIEDYVEDYWQYELDDDVLDALYDRFDVAGIIGKNQYGGGSFEALRQLQIDVRDNVLNILQNNN